MGALRRAGWTVVALGAGWWLAAIAPAEPGPGTTPRQPAYVGTSACVGCHGGRGAPAASPRSAYAQWREDPRGAAHRGAYATLETERSSAMARIVDPKARGALPATGSPRCLACHSASDATSRVGAALDRADGVQCESCHGPAGGPGGWLDAHYQPGWVAKSRAGLPSEAVAAGRAERGFAELRRPDVAAAACLRCHRVGPGAIDHALLAAGHPPSEVHLPRDLASAPLHWRAERGPDAHWRAERGPDAHWRTERGPDAHGRARLWAVSQAVALRELARGWMAWALAGGPASELSAQRCADCHFATSGLTQRARVAEPGSALGVVTSGDAAWTARPRSTAGGVPAADDASLRFAALLAETARPPTSAAIEGLRVAVSARRPDRGQVLAAARVAYGEAVWLVRFAGRTDFDARTRARLLRGLLREARAIGANGGASQRAAVTAVGALTGPDREAELRDQLGERLETLAGWGADDFAATVLRAFPDQVDAPEGSR